MSTHAKLAVLLCIAMFLVAQLAAAAPLQARQPGGGRGGRGGPGGEGRPMGPPGGSRPDFNGTRPDFNGTRPDYNGTRPNGPDGDRARSGGRFGLPVDRLLSSVSSACVAAANSTTAFDVCRPDNSTIAANLTHKDTECSSACTTAVQGYWSTVVAACGSESLVEVVPRNTSIAAFNLTAADLEPIALLELAVGCTKDLSGNWCQGARGGRGGRGGRGPRPDGNRNGTDMAPPRGGNGTENAKGQRGMRGPGGRMPGNDQGRPAFNATICAECTSAALEAITPIETQFPDQSFFGRPEITSWTDFKAEVSGRCDKMAAQATKTMDAAPQATRTA